jgi:cytochrome c oxidase subunit 1
LVFLSFFLVGVVLILESIFIGNYGGAWTFLYPLPAASAGAWEVSAAITFCLGYVFIGVGFLIYHLEMGFRISQFYNGMLGGLGWKFIANDQITPPPPVIIAASSVTVFNSTGILFGAIVLAVNIINMLNPEFLVNALLAKNATYFFGHIFINASIYMAVTAVYEIIPEYTNRPWKPTKLFAVSWALVVFFVQAVYFHHLLQDVNMPGWTLAVGQIISYVSGIPLLAVTSFSLCVYVKGSGLKWDLISKLLILGVGGWTVGSIPATIDGMIVVNKVMHNTQWVPGHFHTYLLLGEVAMAFGFSAWLVNKKKEQGLPNTFDSYAFAFYGLGGLGFVLTFLWSGSESVPRRYAIHSPMWHIQDVVGTLFAAIVVLATLCIVSKYIYKLFKKTKS